MSQQKSKNARPKSARYWATCLLVGALIGFVIGVTGFSFESALKNLHQSQGLQSFFGFDADKPLDVPTILAALFMVFLCVLQCAVLIGARFSAKFSRMAGLEAQLGHGPKGRASLTWLAVFWLMNGLFLLLLSFLEVSNLDGTTRYFIVAMGIIMVGVCTISAVKLWSILDELVRNIWVEATALTCGVMLAGAMILNLLASLELSTGLSLFQGLLFITTSTWRSIF